MLQRFLSRLLLGAVVLGLASLSDSGRALAEERTVIERIEPSSGPPGSLIRISGRRFQAGAKVRVGESALAIEESLPNLITARVPESAQSGWVSVETPAGKVLGPEFVVTEKPAAPLISGIEPARGAPGSAVLIRGQHFSPRMADDTVRFGDQVAIVASASPVELRVIVPELAKTGPVSVRIAQAGEVKSAAAFEVTRGTAITDFSPHSGPPGGTLVITGTGFSADAKKNRVYLNATQTPVSAASETSLTVAVPRDAASGHWLVDVKGGGRATSKESFEVQRAPSIVGFSPEAGPPGTRITVRGTGFGDDPTAVQVLVGDVPAKVVEAKHTQLVVEVPAAAPVNKAGRLSVRVHGVGPAWGNKELMVLPPLSISGFSPRSGPVGSAVFLEGAGFSPNPKHNQVTIAGTNADVVAATLTRLSVRVPQTKSGLVVLQVEGSGRAESLNPFVVTQPPRVTGVSAEQAPVGSELTIHGSGFGETTALVQVALGSQKLTLRSVHEDTIVVALPAAPAKGRLTVTVALQGTGSYGHEIQVTAAP